MIRISSATTVLKITSCDERLKSDCYFARCMECSCNDSCCNYGCPVDITEVERILTYRDELEKRIGIPASDWFMEATESRTEFPSGKIKMTRVHLNSCIFHDNVLRGCHLHRLALEKGIDPHSIKPMVCFLFPLTWDGSFLYVSEFLDELPCKNTGARIMESQINEIRRYIGDDFIKEIELH
jgi:Fe-S-cluster containining protein